MNNDDLLQQHDPIGSLKSFHAAVDAAAPFPFPVIYPDIQISRQYRFHLLFRPGNPDPTFHRTLEEALRTGLIDTFDRLVISYEDDLYFVTKSLEDA